MFAICLSILTVAVPAQASAKATETPSAVSQPKQRVKKYELGSGLTFAFDHGKHEVGIGGFIQPAWAVASEEGNSTEQFLRAKRTYFNLRGSFFDERIDLFAQVDFSLEQPLLDAWLGYNFNPWLSLSMGQRQTLTNNREMLHMESDLAFTERSLLSRTFSESGRELGVFAVGNVELAGFVLRPQLALTSGDGRNAFGQDSRDRDVGGLKYGGRLDALPFGDFSEGNRGMVVDLAREQSLKLVAGAAASYNDGASHRNGAGQGEFFLYDAFGDQQNSDYLLFYADLLAKWRGFSLLFEYVNASATGLDGTFVDEGATIPLVAGQISELLILGNGINVQAGYVFAIGELDLGADVRYARLWAEFDRVPTSLLQDQTGLGGGLALYVFDQSLKLQLNYEYADVDTGTSVHQGEFLVQVIL